ncbi:diaminobutyrate--2-oxoglutarate transaminase [Bacillus cereus]|uniref:diaminobutyrate--2-oxoglutarate transaminase n=1 Tax=Bacillus cereus TaxID=1396 RepID=UPI00187A3042|nr:diaminobutyrate--2-oxoglutarate transaminase [Bacillus cereus]MBE7122191.1 diaminobutyrate--2-oxoglutarate transaminase [Bacillus cereus]
MLNKTTNVFESLESNVRSYCRYFPDVFIKAKDSMIYTESGKIFLDFLAGAGALNYGHNNDFIKRKLLDYIKEDGLTHGLDLYTGAKEEFLQTFDQLILKPKGLNYKVQFCGPTGTNAVEASFKIARKVKKRPGIFSFMGGYHGMSMGSLAATANHYHREGAGKELSGVTFMPHPSTFSFDTIDYMEKLLTDSHSGVDKPSAIIFETIQAEGGVNVASIEWMRRLYNLCRRHDILLICDDIQVGCGRTGDFFSFERAGIIPDIIVLSKSISGYGLPMSIVLLKPELDIWKPAEHNGTFRGNQLAFICATAALQFGEKERLAEEVERKGGFVENFLLTQIKPLSNKIDIRGLGLIWGVDVSRVRKDAASLANHITQRCYELGLLVERVGRNDTVIKLMPPLTISMDELEKGCLILKQAFEESLRT